MLKRTAGLLRPASGDGRDALQNFQDLRGQRAVFHVQNFLRLCARIRKALRRFGQQVRKRRMEMAKTMLADPRLSIAEIAQAVGYSQYTTFYNLFREMEGVSPTDYRNSLL